MTGGRVHLLAVQTVLSICLSLSFQIPSLCLVRNRSTTYQLHLPKWISQIHLPSHQTLQIHLGQRERFSKKSDSSSDASPRCGKNLSLVPKVFIALTGQLRIGYQKTMRKCNRGSIPKKGMFSCQGWSVVWR